MTTPYRPFGDSWLPTRKATSVALAVVIALSALWFTLPVVDVSVASAQEGLTVVEVWGIAGGLGENPKEWKFEQSRTAQNDLGSAGAASPALDDSAWGTETLRWKANPGRSVANHFRKDFNLADLGIEHHQVVGIRAQLQYDDTAVLYLNGTEVYRSIRGNLPDFDEIPHGEDFPYNVVIPYGGAEDFYVHIPDPDLVNACERPDPECSASPYGSAHPPEIPLELLVDGTNTWGITTWNTNPNQNSGDSSANHVFELVIDQNAVQVPVSINEVMAENDSAYTVTIDDDPKTPDWFELANSSTDPVDLEGWTISDDTTVWTFPPGAMIDPLGFLVVVANDGDNAASDPLQTNFQLSSRGDSLKLTTSDGIVADEVGWTDQFTDTSMGLPLGDDLDFTYLETPSPGATNSGPILRAAPVIRSFRDRMYNLGETVDLQIEAFDPDGGDLRYSIVGLPAGLSVDSTTGLVTGTVQVEGTVPSTITVIDNDGDRATADVAWIGLEAARQPSPLVLSEYNAVPGNGQLAGGSAVGNGGDWFEFLVVEDNLDLRGYSIEFRQSDSRTDELRLQTILTFADYPELSRVPAGTLITIGEELATDLSFDGVQDWHVHLQVDNDGLGALFEAPPADSTFNSSRRDQSVLIRDAAGDLAAPLAGETDAWDHANGGVSEREVMNLCISPTQGTTIDPVADYRDNATSSTFGAPNQCVSTDPLNPDVVTQDLGPLRASADFGVGRGDVDCDGDVTIRDALIVAQHAAEPLVDRGPCFVGPPAAVGEIAAGAGDVNRDGVTDDADVEAILSCNVGQPLALCDNLFRS